VVLESFVPSAGLFYIGEPIHAGVKLVLLGGTIGGAVALLRSGASESARALGGTALIGGAVIIHLFYAAMAGYLGYNHNKDLKARIIKEEQEGQARQGAGVPLFLLDPAREPAPIERRVALRW
jgi:hypothetical protein